MLLLSLKLVVVAIFLVMFLRGSRLVWGIGLVTVTTALLLDAFLGTFGPEAVQAQLGFFFYVLSGGLFAGAALWLWGLLRPVVAGKGIGAGGETFTPAAVAAFVPQAKEAPAAPSAAGTAVDRQLLYDQIQTRFGPDDIEDLIFDLALNPNELAVPNQTYADLAVRLMDAAETGGKMGELALAVERVLTPPKPENLPRPGKLAATSPPTVLRHYLLSHYDVADLRAFCRALGIDWEQLGAGGKKELVRGLLRYLYQRNRLEALLAMIQSEEAPAPVTG